MKRIILLIIIIIVSSILALAIWQVNKKSATNKKADIVQSPSSDTLPIIAPLPPFEL